MRVKLTPAHEKELADYISNKCKNSVLLYASNYKDVAYFLVKISRKYECKASLFSRFIELFNNYEDPLNTIDILKGLSIDIEQLQTIIKEAIFKFFDGWLEAHFSEGISPRESKNYYQRCQLIIHPIKPSKRRQDDTRVDVVVKRGRDGEKAKVYNLNAKRGRQYIDNMFKNRHLHQLLSLVDRLHHEEDPEKWFNGTEIGGKLKRDFEKILIGDSDDTAYPRCEFYTRFYASTIYQMNSPKYWGTYHRSESTRFFKKGGGSKVCHFKAEATQDTAGMQAAASHLGNVISPLSLPDYQAAIRQDQPIRNGSINLHDQLLTYRLSMAEKVVHYFSLQYQNRQSVTGPQIEKKRPIVHTDNDYPCVVVHLPIHDPKSPPTASSRFWSEKKNDFNTLAVCVFIAFVNTLAQRKKIPIEMVLRASFGHNLPSACATGSSFRINTGIVPEIFTEVIADALVKTIQALHMISDKNSTVVIDEPFAQDVFLYNATKLKNTIERNKIYRRIKQEEYYADILNPQNQENYKQVRQAYYDINRKKETIGNRSRWVEVDIFKNMTTWKVIRQKGDSQGKTVLSECFRIDRAGISDWFIDRMMEGIKKCPANPVDYALARLVRLLNYKPDAKNDKLGMHTFEFPSYKEFFDYPSFDRYYQSDRPFYDMISKLFLGLGRDKKDIPNYGLYAEIEKEGHQFVRHRRSQFSVSQDGYGSDSEFEVDDVYGSVKRRIAHQKIRVVNGMRAIAVAHHAALAYLDFIGLTSYTLDESRMYFEVMPSLHAVKKGKELERIKIEERPDGKLDLLYFDLNYNNSQNAADLNDLNDLLDSHKPTVIMLDITSSTVTISLDKMRQCLAQSSVQFVMLVESGLKHNQAGLDYNPYGEIRVLSHDKKTTQQVFQFVKDSLQQQDKLSDASHAVIRTFKSRGFARSLHRVFAKNTARHAPIAGNNPTI